MDNAIENNTTKSLRALATILLALVALLFILSREMERIREFIRLSGWIGLVISIALYALLGMSPIPSEPLTVLISTIYGPLSATLVAGLGNLSAACVEYYIGGKIGSIADFDRRRERLPFGLGKIPIASPAFQILGRMLPGYGPKFVSLASGMYRVRLWRNTWTAAISTIIGAAIFAYGGFGLFNLRLI